MTLTEQDEELEKKLMDLFCKTEQFALEFFGGKTSKEEFARNNSSGKTLDHQQAAHMAMQLITADRKRVALDKEEMTLRYAIHTLQDTNKEFALENLQRTLAKNLAQQEEV